MFGLASDVANASTSGSFTFDGWLESCQSVSGHLRPDVGFAGGPSETRPYGVHHI